MPNKKISELDSFDQLIGNEKFPIVQSGANKTSDVSILGTKLNSDVGSAITLYATRVSSNLASAKASNLTSDLTTVQDLTGIKSNLHVSPNAVTAMFVYDTSKDSDGGAWTEKCSSTSWYNETLSGNWLGAYASEFSARNVNAVATGNNLVANSSFDSNTNSWGSSTAILSSVVGKLRIEDNPVSPYTPYAWTAISCTIGKSYIITGQYFGGAKQTRMLVATNDGGSNAQSIYGSTTGSGTVIGYFNATASTMYIIVGCESGVGLATGEFVEFDNITVYEAVQTTQTGDYFQLTTNGKFYSLNSDSGTTEVFRGNKRSFPKLSAIVAENTNVTIYDLTEPGRPMWMRFYSNSAMLHSSTTSVAALNGVMITSGSARLFNFITDKARRLDSGGTFNQPISFRNISTGLATLNDLTGSVQGTTPYVAMTVLPDAPVDQSMGIPHPTIGLAGTQGYVLLREGGPGIVLNSSVHMEGRTRLGANFIHAHRYLDGGNNNAFFGNIRTLTSGSTFPISATTIPDYGTHGTTPPSTVFSTPNGIEQARSTATGLLNKLRYFPSSYTKGVTSRIANTYNTGHTIGDIRRTYLSDVDVGSMTGTNIIADPTFKLGVGPWTGYNSTISTTGPGNLTATTTGAGLVGFSTVLNGLIGGKTYTILLGLGAGIYFDNGSGANVYQGSIRINGSVTSNFGRTTDYNNITFVAPGNTATLDIVCGFNYYSAWSLKYVYVVGAISNERSYKDTPYVDGGMVGSQPLAAIINGTLTKSPVATNAQLVGYSGFSNSNYLREPASTDLDFGTGEWSASAWVNTLRADPDANLCTFPEALNNSAMSGITYTAAGIANPVNGDVTANQLVATNGTTGTPTFGFPYTDIRPLVLTESYGLTISLYIKSKGSTRLRYFSDYADSNAGTCDFDIVAGNVLSTTNSLLEPTITAVQGKPGWFRIAVRIPPSYRMQPKFYFSDAYGNFTFTGDGVTGIYAYGMKYNGGYSAGTYTPGKTAAYVPVPGARVFSRSFISGPNIDLGVNGYGQLVATVTDSAGTPVTRTITSANAYNTGTWNKVDVTYTTNGTLSLYVNGQQAATPVTGSALASISNTNAVLTIGNNYSANAPFPGSLALVKLSATVPTDEQRVWMYEQEKMMFQPGAQVCLPSSGAVNDLSYDSRTDTWYVAQSSHLSEFKGLVRTAYRKPAASTYSKIATDSGVKLIARASGTVELEIAPIQLKKEFSSSLIDSTINNQNISIFEFDSIASQTDFVLPIGFTAQAVYLAGTLQIEGASKNYTRLFDGFRETIRFGTAPATNSWVKIKAVRS